MQKSCIPVFKNNSIQAVIKIFLFLYVGFSVLHINDVAVLLN